MTIRCVAKYFVGFKGQVVTEPCHRGWFLCIEALVLSIFATLVIFLFHLWGYSFKFSVTLYLHLKPKGIQSRISKFYSRIIDNKVQGNGFQKQFKISFCFHRGTLNLQLCLVVWRENYVSEWLFVVIQKSLCWMNPLREWILVLEGLCGIYYRLKKRVSLINSNLKFLLIIRYVFEFFFLVVYLSLEA